VLVVRVQYFEIIFNRFIVVVVYIFNTLKSMIFSHKFEGKYANEILPGFPFLHGISELLYWSHS
jgi:hypothetical protein